MHSMPPFGESVKPVFATYAPQMRSVGFAVLPSHGKSPIRKGFSTMKHAPGSATVAKWAERDPDADIVYVPGLSRTKRRREIIAVDGDDMEAVERCLDEFGDTPGKTRTRRGKHMLYEGDGTDLGKLSSLKKFGINADIKHGMSIAVAPPSRHPDERSFSYAWDGCDETVIRDLPRFNYSALRALVQQSSRRRENSIPETSLGTKPNFADNGKIGLRDGSRKLALNDWLYGRAWAFSSEHEMLGAAFVRNKEIGGADPRGPLDGDEVMEVAAAVWKDREAGKIEKLAGAASRDKRHRQELDLLASIHPKLASDAYVLLQVFRDEHSARCRRGETFTITVQAMARAQVITGWSWWRYDRARELLLKAGLIQKASKYIVTADGRLPAQYALTCCLPVSGAGAARGQDKLH